jgi:hypothetical protein
MTTIRSTATTIGRGLEPLDARTDPRTKLDGQMSRILVVKEKRKKQRSYIRMIIFFPIVFFPFLRGINFSQIFIYISAELQIIIASIPENEKVNTHKTYFQKMKNTFTIIKVAMKGIN